MTRHANQQAVLGQMFTGWGFLMMWRGMGGYWNDNLAYAVYSSFCEVGVDVLRYTPSRDIKAVGTLSRPQFPGILCFKGL